MKTYAAFYLRGDFIVDVAVEDGAMPPQLWQAVDKLKSAIAANPAVLVAALSQVRTPAMLVTDISDRLDVVSVPVK